MATKSLPKQREEVLNARLGSLLIERHPRWNQDNLHIESSNTLRNGRGLRIDVLVENPGAQPVAIETKFEAPGVGKALREQVEQRLGLALATSGHIIESAISVKWPGGLKSAGVASAKLAYAVHQLGEDDRVLRWPERDEEWMQGGIDDIADAVEVVSLSRKRILEGSRILEWGVHDASRRLEISGESLDALAEVLHQESGEQTTRMAVAIVINAFVFHHAIEQRAGIPPVSKGRGELGFFLTSRVLRSWRQVLAVNYWPVFSIATKVIESLPESRAAAPLLNAAGAVAEHLAQLGATSFHDLAARMFQTLIADRKFLATFYTLPESACLLAELAVAKLDVDWSDQEAVKALKVADFACGTGTLLSSVQAAVYRRLRRRGLDDRELHRHFMERVLLGTDIMPSAAHLATSMLSSAHPDIIYHDSLIHVMPYGLDEEVSRREHVDANRTYIGALDLRTTETAAINIFSQSGFGNEIEIEGQRMTGTGTRDAGGNRSLPAGHGTFDLVIMNPPFTRPTNHEGDLSVPVPSFAGFGTSKDEQLAMSRRLRAHPAVFGHGNAGLASNFMDLAHDKLKPGGVLALVVPFAFVSGGSWEPARRALSQHYRDINIVSIVSSGTTDAAFSADTGMAECLIVAKRVQGTDTNCNKLQFINLPRRPRTLLEAHEFAIRHGRWSIEATRMEYGAAGIRDVEVVQSMIALVNGVLQLPRESREFALSMTRIGDLAQRGLLHRDITGAGGRGAFDVQRIREHGIATYPALWRHHADHERRLTVMPDTEGVVRKGMQSQANNIWNSTASRLHHNLDFRLNSQSLAVCLTPDLSLGGRAWPNLLPERESYLMPLLLWGNSTLGLMTFWWFGSRQQTGRACVTISTLPELPTIDCTALSDTQLQKFEEAFDALSDARFLPANEAYRDETRQRLDEKVFEILGLPESTLKQLDVLRRKWCCEPSVHGGKSTKPKEP